MSDPDKIRIALTNLLQSLVDCQSFEVEAGCAGDGPMFQAYRALGVKPPKVLSDWAEDEYDSWDD